MLLHLHFSITTERSQSEHSLNSLDFFLGASRFAVHNIMIDVLFNQTIKLIKIDNMSVLQLTDAVVNYDFIVTVITTIPLIAY